MKLSQGQLKDKGYSLTFRVNSSTHVYNAMVNALKRAGFDITSGSNWNVLWTGFPGSELIKKALKFQ